MMRQEIVDIGKNAYYDCIEHKTNNGDFSILELFIHEFREQLSKILPKNKEFNKDINFEESFDTMLIIQMIKNNAFDKEDFLKLFNYFFDLFMKLQPAEDDKELIKYFQTAKDEGLKASLITDAGRTVIAPGTKTCVGIGPDDEEKIDSITGELSLL